MIIKLLPFLLAGLLLYLLVQRLKKLPLEKRKGTLIKYTVYTLIGLLLLAVVTGRLHWLGAVVAAALGLLKIGAATLLRFLPFLRVLRNNKVFGDPVFRTSALELTLDINRGSISGTILQGKYAGRDLVSLSAEEFDHIESELKHGDPRSLYLLRIARSRLQGAAGSYNKDFDANQNISAPSLEEARMILGLAESYSRDDVIRAHKRLIQKLHPDRGGNDYLASRINLARDLIIEHLDKKN